MSLEGLEHVLSIVLCSTQSQIPRNYAGFRDWGDIDQRPKTAIGKQDAGKMWAKTARSAARSDAFGEGPHSSAFDSKFQHADFEHNA